MGEGAGRSGPGRPVAFDWRDGTFGGPIEARLPLTAFNGIAVVGKAPGSQEVISGIPFSGKSGKLLDDILERAGIEASGIVLANAFRYQPAWTVGEDGRRRDNDETLFFTDERALGNERLPTYAGRWVLRGPDEDVRELWRVLRRVKPRVIVACGAVATWALTGRDQIGQAAGTFLETSCVDAPVMATYHPAYALRREAEDVAQRIVADFVKARERCEELQAAA